MMKLATQVLASKLGSSASNNYDLLQSVIGNLLGGSGGQGIDLGSIVGSLQGGGLADIAESWLGNGSNADISPSQIESLLGSDKLKEAASQLGANQDELLAGLREMLPQVVDKSSSDGNLLDAVGGLSGLANLAGKFLK
ncbi:MAG: YidB family protein [Arenicella sp.]|nr:YidB family protein [Arenicella sp.]